MAQQNISVVAQHGIEVPPYITLQNILMKLYSSALYTVCHVKNDCFSFLIFRVTSLRLVFRWYICSCDMEYFDETL